MGIREDIVSATNVNPALGGLFLLAFVLCDDAQQCMVGTRLLSALVPSTFDSPLLLKRAPRSPSSLVALCLKLLIITSFLAVAIGCMLGFIDVVLIVRRYSYLRSWCVPCSPSYICLQAVC